MEMLPFKEVKMRNNYVEHLEQEKNELKRELYANTDGFGSIKRAVLFQQLNFIDAAIRSYKQNSKEVECPGCGVPIIISLGAEWITCGICGHDDMIK